MNLPWPHGDPRDVARAIVADPRFHGTTSADAPAPSLWVTALTWIGDRLRDLFHAIGHVLGARNPLGTALGVAVLVVIAVALVLSAVRIARLPGRRAVSASASAGAGGDSAGTSDAWLARALAAARAERWHEAAAALVRAAFHRLDEVGRLRFDPSRTPGEARRALHDPAFDAFVHEANPALYAAHAATGERFARLRAAYGRCFGEPG